MLLIDNPNIYMELLCNKCDSSHLGARELARDARASEPGDFMNSVVGGFASGALLGRVQG